MKQIYFVKILHRNPEKKVGGNKFPILITLVAIHHNACRDYIHLIIVLILVKSVTVATTTKSTTKILFEAE